MGMINFRSSIRRRLGMQPTHIRWHDVAEIGNWTVFYIVFSLIGFSILFVGVALVRFAVIPTAEGLKFSATLVFVNLPISLVFVLFSFLLPMTASFHTKLLGCVEEEPIADNQSAAREVQWCLEHFRWLHRMACRFRGRDYAALVAAARDAQVRDSDHPLPNDDPLVSPTTIEFLTRFFLTNFCGTPRDRNRHSSGDLGTAVSDESFGDSQAALTVADQTANDPATYPTSNKANMRRFLLILTLGVSVLGLGLCLMMAASRFVGPADLMGPEFLLIILAIFPLFSAAAVIIGRRAQGRQPVNLWSILLADLPGWFRTAFRLYYILVWLAVMAAFVQVFRGQPGLIGLIFVLVPSVFYAACVAVYWSELRQET